jgi:hypothetical protein
MDQLKEELTAQRLRLAYRGTGIRTERGQAAFRRGRRGIEASAHFSAAVGTDASGHFDDGEADSGSGPRAIIETPGAGSYDTRIAKS